MVTYKYMVTAKNLPHKKIFLLAYRFESLNIVKSIYHFEIDKLINKNKNISFYFYI